jgi:hypothetical protein
MSKNRFNTFMNLAQGGWTWSKFLTNRRFVRVFVTPSNGKWKVEWDRTLVRGIYEPRRYSSVVIGSPKWDINCTMFKTLELSEYYYATKAHKRL